MLIAACFSKQTLFPDTPYGQPVQIPLQQGASRRHCLSARTVYTFIDIKYSQFSEPSCIFLEAPGGCRAALEWNIPALLPCHSGDTRSFMIEWFKV